MAESYESTVADAMESLVGENSGLSTETQAAVQQILDDLAATGTEAVQIADVQTGTLTNESLAAAGGETAQVITMGADASAEITFAADSPVRVMAVGGGGSSNVVFETSEPVAVQLGGGENDSVATGGGDDTITFAGGSATIDTGAGNDVVQLTGRGSATVQGGAGNMVVQVSTTETAATIDAGDGFDRVNLVQSAKSAIFTFDALLRQFVMRVVDRFSRSADGDDAPAESAPINMAGVNVVTFDETGDGTPDAVTVLANSQGDAIIACLYQIALGRYAIDTGADAQQQLQGIEFWVDQFDQSNTQHLVYSFLNCDEFHARYDGMDNMQYVQALFDNLGAANDTTITTIDGKTVADFAATITDDPISRYDVAWTIATSQEAINILGADGEAYFVDGYSV